MKHPAMNLIAAGLAILGVLGAAAAQNKPDPLKSGFENPPESLRCWAWCV
jgi:hypothetical protein